MLKFQKHMKERSNGFTFAPVPLPVYNSFASNSKVPIEKDPLSLMAVSRLLSGSVFGQNHEVELHNGTKVHIGIGETWASITTICEDINAAVGGRYTRRQVRYALEKVEERGLIESSLVIPASKGAFGKRFKLSAAMLETESPMVDVIQTYKIYYYGDPSEFYVGESVVGDKTTRGNYKRIQPWINWIAGRGNHLPCFTTIGRWRYGEAGKHDAPVLVPWVYIELDRVRRVNGKVVSKMINYDAEQDEVWVDPDVAELAWNDTMEIVGDLEEQGFDMERVFVSVSGHKGFHIAISTDQFGSPIFYDSVSARETIKTMIESITDLPVDPHTNTPTALIRLTGSVHEKTQMRKRTWTAARYQTLTMNEIFADLRAHQPFTYPDPTIGAVEEDVLKRFEAAAHEAALRIKEVREQARVYGSKIGTVIETLLNGIEESEQWHDRYCGRNWAAYIMACWLLESEGQQRGVAYHLGYTPKAPFGSEEAAWELYLRWDLRNGPPLQTDPNAGERRGLKTAFKSAKRKLVQNRKP